MTDDTQIIEKQEDGLTKKSVNESHLFNVSMRGWIALIVVATICVMSIMGGEVKEPLYTLGGMVVGFYFAQNQKPKSQT